MNIHEYQAKDLFEKFSVPSPKEAWLRAQKRQKKLLMKLMVKL